MTDPAAASSVPPIPQSADDPTTARIRYDGLTEHEADCLDIVNAVETEAEAGDIPEAIKLAMAKRFAEDRAGDRSLSDDNERLRAENVLLKSQRRDHVDYYVKYYAIHEIAKICNDSTLANITKYNLQLNAARISQLCSLAMPYQERERMPDPPIAGAYMLQHDGFYCSAAAAMNDSRVLQHLATYADADAHADCADIVRAMIDFTCGLISWTDIIDTFPSIHDAPSPPVDANPPREAE